MNIAIMWAAKNVTDTLTDPELASLNILCQTDGGRVPKDHPLYPKVEKLLTKFDRQAGYAHEETCNAVSLLTEQRLT